MGFPGFSKNVIYDEEAACRLRALHEMVMKGIGEFKKEETLLRAFIKDKGVTPYRYLETVPINEAKRLLSEGELP